MHENCRAIRAYLADGNASVQIEFSMVSDGGVTYGDGVELQRFCVKDVMRGNTWCDAACNNAACDFDLGDCKGCADGAPLLADGDDGGFMNKVALRAAPQREKPAKPTLEKAVLQKAAEKPEPVSPFAKLKGLFSG